MSGTKRMKRKYTARELAERFGVTPRHVRRIVAQERDEWIAEAIERRQKAAELRAQGLRWAAVGQELGISADAARMLVSRVKPTDQLLGAG